METLNSYCLPPIFSFLPLADLLCLQLVPRWLKREVEDYLPNVRSLPLYLTTPRTPEAIVKYERLFEPDKPIGRDSNSRHSRNLSDEFCIRRLTFGNSGFETYEDGTILQNQNHFRLGDFFAIHDAVELWDLLPFVQKHCPKIVKLALVIDCFEHYLPEVVKILKAFPGIKVLLLESTLQESCRHDDTTPGETENTLFQLRCLKKNQIVLPPSVYYSIMKLNNLEELYLFSKRQSQLVIKSINIAHREEHPKYSLENWFVMQIIIKLRVLHFNSNEDIMAELSENEDFNFEFPVTVCKKLPLRELASGPYEWFTDKRYLSFPELKKFTFLNSNWSLLCFEELRTLPRPALKTLDVSNANHCIRKTSMRNLNKFTGLESFHCGHLTIDSDDEDGEEENEENVEPVKKRKREDFHMISIVNSCWGEEVDDDDINKKVSVHLKNWTIKHLQVMSGPGTAKDRNRLVRRWSKYFIALETCVFLEPEYSEIVVSELQE